MFKFISDHHTAESGENPEPTISWGKLFNLSQPVFFICKMEPIIPALLGMLKDKMRYKITRMS